MRKQIKQITLSSIISSLIVVLIMIGSFVDIFDLTVAALCSLLVYIIGLEIGGKYPLLVYGVSSALCIILMPMTTATLYYVAFFGYYPILRTLFKKLKKGLRKAICLIIFNIVMAGLMLLFKAVFALQNEPAAIYIALLVTVNIFFFCFDRLIDVFHLIYFKKIRSKINFKI